MKTALERFAHLLAPLGVLAGAGVAATACSGEPVWTVRATLIRVGPTAVDRLDLSFEPRGAGKRFSAQSAHSYEGGSVVTAVNPDGELVVEISGARVQAGLRQEGDNLVYDETFWGGEGEASDVYLSGQVVRDGTLPIAVGNTFVKFPPADGATLEVLIQCDLSEDCSM